MNWAALSETINGLGVVLGCIWLLAVCAGRSAAIAGAIIFVGLLVVAPLVLGVIAGWPQ